MKAQYKLCIFNFKRGEKETQMKGLLLLILNQIFTMTPGWAKLLLIIIPDLKTSKDRSTRQSFFLNNSSISPMFVSLHWIYTGKSPVNHNFVKSNGSFQWLTLKTTSCGVKSYPQIFNCSGICSPNPSIVLRSTVPTIALWPSNFTLGYIAMEMSFCVNQKIYTKMSITV